MTALQISSIFCEGEISHHTQHAPRAKPYAAKSLSLGSTSLRPCYHWGVSDLKLGLCAVQLSQRYSGIADQKGAYGCGKAAESRACDKWLHPSAADGEDCGGGQIGRPSPPSASSKISHKR